MPVLITLDGVKYEARAEGDYLLDYYTYWIDDKEVSREELEKKLNESWSLLKSEG
jgi:hypothetical protein